MTAQLAHYACSGHAVCAVRGELDTGTADTALAALIAGYGEVRLIADLAGLEFLDCGGANALIRAKADAQARGGDLVPAALHGEPQRLLTLTGAACAFQIFTTVEQAAQAARPGQLVGSAPQASSPPHEAARECMWR
jgi:anti-anti-sigma factor